MIFNYITTNKISKKRYVGSHEGGFTDSYLGSGIALKKAIKKHGRGNFQRDVLSVVTTREEAFKNERFLIEMYKTLVPTGYNVSLTGGLGVPGCFLEETKKVISESQKGEKNSMYGRRGKDAPWHGKGYLQMGVNNPVYGKGYLMSGEKNGWYGKTGKDNPFSKPLLQFTKSGEFIKEWECGSEVQRVLGIFSTNISACIYGKQKTAGGFVWKFKKEIKQ